MAPPPQQSVRRAVAQFAVTGLAAVLLLGLVAVQILRSTGRTEAIRDSKRLTRLAGEGIVAPELTPGVLAGRPGDLRRLDRVIRRRVRREPVVRVKIWSSDGRIVYSDKPRLVGARYHLGDEEHDAIRHRKTDAELSDLGKPENRYERHFGELLEVYEGVRSTDGRSVLFETYQRYSSIAASGSRLWRRFLPALIGALLVLELVQIPLAYLLARRLRDRQRERAALLEQAVDASEAERRRVAAELHDGPVQDLAGVAFGLAGAAERLPEGEARREVLGAARRARATMRELRSMLVELSPPALRRAGLVSALDDLVARLQAEGVAVESHVQADLVLSEQAEAVLFRAAREALQNVRKHAGASEVQLTLTVDDGDAVLTVADNGRGMDGDGRAEPGHMGLELLAALASESGGRLDVTGTGGRGTTLRLELPVG